MPSESAMVLMSRVEIFIRLEIGFVDRESFSGLVFDTITGQLSKTRLFFQPPAVTL